MFTIYLLTVGAGLAFAITVGFSNS
jgi:hypothetical protein